MATDTNACSPHCNAAKTKHCNACHTFCLTCGHALTYHDVSKVWNPALPYEPPKKCVALVFVSGSTYRACTACPTGLLTANVVHTQQ